MAAERADTSPAVGTAVACVLLLTTVATPGLSGMATAQTISTAVARPALLQQAPTWDFETGTLRGWERSGTAFEFQPTFGDNPTARDRGQPSNHQGQWWIGTFERYQGRQGERPGTVQGDQPQGTLTSAVFTIPSTLSFLVGGGSAFETRIELRVIDPVEGPIRVLYASGRDSETLRRVVWDLSEWAGQRGRIRIVDASSGGWGHINADDFRFGPEDPPPDASPAALVLDPATVELAPGETAAIAVRVDSDVWYSNLFRSFQAAFVPADVAVERRCFTDAPTVATAEWAQPVCQVTAVAPGETTARVEVTAGTQEAEGAAVVRVVSVVPPVLELTERVAGARLSAARLRAGPISRRVSTAPEGTVVDQSPDAGARVPPGSAVELVLAAPALVEVPFLVGTDDRDAAAELVDAGLRSGDASGRISLQAGGTVLAQMPAGGELVAPGTPVELEVALPRLLWAGPAAILVALLGFLGLRSTRAPRDDPDGRTRLSELEIRPRPDPGAQALDGPVGTPRFEIRLRPRMDAGSQEIDVDPDAQT